MKKTGIIANGSASPDHAGEPKKSSASVQPKSPAKAAAKKESPKKTAKVEQPKAVAVEISKAEKKSEVQQKKKEPKPVDYDEGKKNSVLFFPPFYMPLHLVTR